MSVDFSALETCFRPLNTQFGRVAVTKARPIPIAAPKAPNSATANCQPLTANCQLLTANCQLPTANRQLRTPLGVRL